jgi:hypothetical protein
MHGSKQIPLPTSIEDNDMNAIPPQPEPTSTHGVDATNRKVRGLRHAGLAVCLLLSLLLCPDMGSAAVPGVNQIPILPQPSEDIPCEQSPFGRRLPLGEDAEMIDLLDFSAPQNPELLHEWELSSDTEPGAPPLLESIESSWTYYNENALAGSTLLNAIRTDLDGNGRDEIVVAVRMNGGAEDGNLKLAVLRREPFTPSIPIELYSTWTLAEPFAGVELAAGDFDGSQDGREELAVMVRSGNPQRLIVFVLTGNEQGGIADNDNAWSGFWTWQPASSEVGVADLAAGDLLLNGRDQIVVVAESDQLGAAGQNRRLNYHLLEFESQTAVLPVAPGNIAVASRSWSTLVGNVLKTGSGGGTESTIHDQGIVGIKVNAGDVIGDATEEFLVLYDFQVEEDSYRVIQRLHHFKATRDDGNVITGIELAKRDDAIAGVDYDDSTVVRSTAPVAGRWDAIVHNIDAEAKGEIVIASEKVELETPILDMAVYKPAYDLTASFRFHRLRNHVQFTDTSVGIGPGPFQPHWDFGDGEEFEGTNPTHQYAEDLGYNPTVTLTIYQGVGDDFRTSTYSQDIHLDSESEFEDGGGIDSSEYFFQIPRVPYYESSYFPEGPEGSRAFDPISIGAGDMDRDGAVEIMSLARMGTDDSPGSGWLRSVWHVDYDVLQSQLVGSHMLEPTSEFSPNSDLVNLFALAVDFDGDSVEATIGADCRSVIESQMRQLVWAPPYFQRLQATAQRSASFGESTTQGTSEESQFGTFTSHDISGYIGTSLGVDLFGLVGASASVRATAGHYQQSARGGLVGSENANVLTEGWTQYSGDALLTLERNKFDCYSYDVSQASNGADPASSIRICEIRDPDKETAIGGYDPEYWNREFPQDWASGSEGHPPPNWAPVTREWSSLSLFRPIRTNATFVTDAGPEMLTDGRFTTHAESETRFQPYVEIDLGAVRSIGNIRVFAPDGEHAEDLTGFRLYTSTTPMPESGLPGGPNVQVFTPDTLNGAVDERWNVWTRVWDDSDPGAVLGDPLRMRYIRLQHPGEARIKVGEIQVFGAAHNDPPRYPDAICDPVRYDGLFQAKVWDGVDKFRAIEVHGDLLWNGSGPEAGLPSWGSENEYLDRCENDSDLQDSAHNFEIWKNKEIGPSGEADWSFVTSSGTSTGDTTSFETSNRVGAEFELTLSAFASFVTGGAEEWESGVTEEHQSVSFWSEDVDMGGSISGFQPPYDDASHVADCLYNARPYAYKLVERSDVGYGHTIYVVDYVVPEGIAATAWVRGDVPGKCLPDAEAGEEIFASGFEAP